jgi:hypothetical protein
LKVWGETDASNEGTVLNQMMHEEGVTLTGENLRETLAYCLCVQHKHLTDKPGFETDPVMLEDDH